MKLASSLPVPVGEKLEKMIEIAFKAKRPVLLIGQSGIGKSESAVAIARRMGIDSVTIDLSLIEPPDLIGIPFIEDSNGVKSTRHAKPSILPVSGSGILIIEELNRCESYVRVPILQLMTSRSLHQYVLPEDWMIIGCVNPDNGGYHVHEIDPALESRFLRINVIPDRTSWIVWAKDNDIHSAVINLAKRYDGFFEDVSPRSWKYISDICMASSSSDIESNIFAEMASGYIPMPWVQLINNELLNCPDKTGLVNAEEILQCYDSKTSEIIKGICSAGRIDVLNAIVTRLLHIFNTPDLSRLIREFKFDLISFESFIKDIAPGSGDFVESLQESFGRNPSAFSFLDPSPDHVLKTGAKPYSRIFKEWNTGLRRHMGRLFISALIVHIDQHLDIYQIRKQNHARSVLGEIIRSLDSVSGPLVETLKLKKITPIFMSGGN